MNGWPIALLTAIGMCIGLLGTLVPVIPGLFLSLVMMVIYGVVSGFGPVGIAATAIAAALCALGTYLGFRIPQKRAASTGLTVADQLVAVVLAIIGAFVIPVVGVAVGFALGVFLAQYRRQRVWQPAKDATMTTLAAMLRASFAQFLCGCAMFACWLVWVGI